MYKFLPLRLTITVLAMAILIARIVWPDELAKIDAVGLGLIVAAALPWLQPILKSVKVPGVGEFELQEMQEKISQAKEIADDAQGAAASAFREAQLAGAGRLKTDKPLTKSKSSAPSRLLEFDKLARKYEQIRDRESPSARRTEKMTQIMRSMIDAAPFLEATNYNPTEALQAGEQGTRLGAYAYSCPENVPVDALIHAVTRERKPFGQYWGLRAVRRSISNLGSESVGDQSREELEQLLPRLRSTWDRTHELRRILRDLKDSEDA